MAELTIFSVGTKAGTSKSGHGISYSYNQTPTGRRNREGAKKRNIDNQRALANWHNEKRSKSQDVPFPTRRTS